MPDPNHRPLTQAERSAISDRRLMDAAIRLIVERGTEKTTLKALGDVAGYSRGLVTYRFGSKTGLFKAVIINVSERWAEEVERCVDGKRGLAAILETAETYYRFVQRSPVDIRAMQILLHVAVEPGSGLVDIAGKVACRQRERVSAWVREGQADSEIRGEVDPETFAAHYCAHIEGMTLAWMRDRDCIDWGKAHQSFKTNIRKELGVAKAAPGNEERQHG